MRAALDRDPRLVLAVGSLEQHGPHLPLGTNVRIADHVAGAVAARLGVLKAPAFTYGVTVGRGAFTGAAGLRRKTLHRAVNELLAHWEDDGVREFLIVTAHRYEPHLEALLMALTGDATTSVYDLYQVDVSDVLEGDPELEHAGELETSVMLHLAPDLVRRDRIREFAPTGPALRRYIRGRVPTPPAERGGHVGHPERATADKGARVLKRWIDALVEAAGANRGTGSG